MEFIGKGIKEGLSKIQERYDMDDETVVKDFERILVECCRKYVTQMQAAMPSRPQSGAAVINGVKVKVQRRRNAYNMYVKAKFAELKADDPEASSQDTMAEVSRGWRQVSATEKQLYQDMADKYNTDNGTDMSNKKKTRSGKRRVTGYNIFYRDMHNDIKLTKDETDSLMIAVGKQWRALSADEQAEWNEKARQEEATKQGLSVNEDEQ